MTKKLFLAFALILIGFSALANLASAEQGSTAYSGKKYYEQSVFVDAWNPGTGTIGANAVVVFDTTGTLGDSAGCAITTTGTRNDPAVFGVADGLILANSVGRVCVRGPHLVQITKAELTINSSFAAGILFAASSTNSMATTFISTGAGSVGGQGIVGITMSAGTAMAGTLTAGVANPSTFWIWVQPQRL